MRLIHDGFATLRVIDDQERTWVFDPQHPEPAEVYIFSGLPDAFAARGLVQAVQTGTAPVVVAHRAAHDWIRSLGTVDVHEPGELLGASLTALPYAPPPEARAPRRGLRARVKARLSERGAEVTMPELRPVAWRFEVPDGHVVVHMGVALHEQTPAGWLDEARSMLLPEHTNMVAGYGLDQETAFIGHIRALRPHRLLLMDLNNDRRRQEGRITPLITPTRDALLSHGLETHVFVSGVSQRFEPDNTVKRW